MLRRLATLSACAVVLTLFGPPPAHADSRTLVDGRGDVWAMDSPEVGQNTQAPNRQQNDILRTVFAHHDRKVVVRTKFARLDRVGEMWLMAINLRTSTGKLRRIALFAGPGQWRGSVIRGNGASQTCARHRIDYVANVVEVAVPRRCLGDPRWVQASMAAGTIAGNGVFYADNPVNEGPSVRLPPLTARIFRG
jgi:hypothetical protein